MCLVTGYQRQRKISFLTVLKNWFSLAEQHVRRHNPNQISSQRLPHNMTNFTAWNFPNTSVGGETGLLVTVWVTVIFNVIVNSITCPFTVSLNVLVIMAVNRRPRLQSNTNILLACLAVTDAATGLIVQPSFIAWMILKLLGMPNQSTLLFMLNSSSRTLFVCSSLHLTLVTFERLIAIKFTMHYPQVLTKKNIKVAVIVFWVAALSIEVGKKLSTNPPIFVNLVTPVVLFSCTVFVAFSYTLLYRETRRHEKKIKAQQLPQEEVERFARESKVLKTTVYVIGAVVICFTPVVVFVTVFNITKVTGHEAILRESNDYDVFWTTTRTCGVLNSLLNPLIYCWRQREMRRFIFGRFSANQDVQPAGWPITTTTTTIFICTHSCSKKITTMKILKVKIRVLAAWNNHRG